MTRNEIRRVVIDIQPNLVGFSPEGAVRQIAGELARRGHPSQVMFGNVLLEEHFAREILEARIYASLRYNPKWCCYKASYRGVEDHFYIHTTPEDSPGSVWTIDVYLQRRLRIYDNNLIPNGLFHPFTHPENRKRFRRYGIQILALPGRGI